jgi:hypothetical protein
MFFPYFVGEKEVGTNILLFIVFRKSRLQVGLPRRTGGHRGAAFGATDGSWCAQMCTISFTLPTSVVKYQMTEMLHLHRQTFLFIEREEVAQPAGPQFVGAKVR